MIVLDASVVVELLTNCMLADSIRDELAGRDESFLVPPNRRDSSECQIVGMGVLINLTCLPKFRVA